jgi:hypothetical protein
MEAMNHFSDVADLNAKVREPVAFSGAGDADARRQVGVHPIDGSSSVEDLRPYRRAVRWRLSSPRVQLRNQFRCMAFAQLTYRESLRDIATLSFPKISSA